MAGVGDVKHYAGGGEFAAVSSTVTTLPVGFRLGDILYESGIRYKLLFNAGGASITAGCFVTPAGSSGPYSMTVTMATATNAHIGAAVCYNATAATATYFWGATHGYLTAGMFGGNISCATGNKIMLDTDGAVTPYPILPGSISTAFQGNFAVGVALTSITTGVRTGTVLLSLPSSL